ncbi:MAG: molybdopterin-dependent oxidoreductase, partial [Planctomycetota bacterium]|nr:molybdopterin-dependent oxidoreductase [Planctomycetota bacterium]
MTSLRITGLIARELALNYEDFREISPEFLVDDIAAVMPGRDGQAITLLGLLSLCQPSEEAQFLGLHGSLDDFHASIPLDAVLERGLIQYGKDGQELDIQAGGPYRFLIPDHAACNTDEIDECANVKFLDHIEFTAERGFDNRP